MKVAITTSSFAKFSDAPLKLLDNAGIEYTLNTTGRTLSEAEALDFYAGCVGIAAGTENITREVMQANPQLKVISRCGTGMDSVDLNTAKTLGIKICNTPDGPTLAVVELTLGFMLDLMRQVSYQDRELRSGIWKKRMGNLLLGKHIGIVGFGRIGQTLAKYLQPFGVEIAYYDPFVTIPEYTKLSLDEIVIYADILTLHCAKPEGNHPLLDMGKLSSMRQGSFIINAARGGLLDESALCGLLTAGHLGGAALDVFGKEPYDGPLKSLDNVILTPHIGSYAKEARIIMETDTIKNLLGALLK